MMLFNNIKQDVLFELEKLHMSLDHLYEIERSYIDDSFKGIPESILAKLVRKGFLTMEGKITSTGKLFYEIISKPDFVSSTSNIKKELKKIKGTQNEQYLEWISLYPATASWVTTQGYNFSSSRKLRTNTPEAEQKYLAILNEKKYTHEDMKNVLLYQIALIQKESVLKEENKMEYMQGTIPYLNQRTFENYLEEMKRKNWQPTLITVNQPLPSMGNAFGVNLA